MLRTEWKQICPWKCHNLEDPNFKLDEFAWQRTLKTTVSSDVMHNSLSSVPWRPYTRTFFLVQKLAPPACKQQTTNDKKTTNNKNVILKEPPYQMKIFLSFTLDGCSFIKLFVMNAQLPRAASTDKGRWQLWIPADFCKQTGPCRFSRYGSEFVWTEFVFRTWTCWEVRGVP